MMRVILVFHSSHSSRCRIRWPFMAQVTWCRICNSSLDKTKPQSCTTIMLSVDQLLGGTSTLQLLFNISTEIRTIAEGVAPRPDPGPERRPSFSRDQKRICFYTTDSRLGTRSVIFNKKIRNVLTRKNLWNEGLFRRDAFPCHGQARTLNFIYSAKQKVFIYRLAKYQGRV